VTLDDVRALVAEVERQCDCEDDERAHSAEDDLRYQVLLAISQGSCELPAEAAALALSTESFGFARWCA
jgi:hypothetical protein